MFPFIGAQPANANVMKRLALAFLSLYKAVLSPYMPGQCRFTPTCSEYAAEAIRTRGVIKGSYLTTKRLARCQPWRAGGFDPVPGPSPRT